MVRVAKRVALLTLISSSTTTTIDTVVGSSALNPLCVFLSYTLIHGESAFYKIPSSNAIARKVFAPDQLVPHCPRNLLALFAIRTLLQSRTRMDNGEEYFVHFSENVCPLEF